MDTRAIGLSEQMRSLILAAARLVDDLDGQQRRAEDAFRAGVEIGFDHGYAVGHAHAERDMDVPWTQLSRRIRGGANATEFAARRAAELEACKPRPGDFPGLDNDPHALDAYRLPPSELAGADNRQMRRTR